MNAIFNIEYLNSFKLRQNIWIVHARSNAWVPGSTWALFIWGYWINEHLKSLEYRAIPNLQADTWAGAQPWKFNVGSALSDIRSANKLVATWIKLVSFKQPVWFQHWRFQGCWELEKLHVPRRGSAGKNITSLRTSTSSWRLIETWTWAWMFCWAS